MEFFYVFISMGLSVHLYLELEISTHKECLYATLIYNVPLFAKVVAKVYISIVDV